MMFSCMSGYVMIVQFENIREMIAETASVLVQNGTFPSFESRA